MSNEVSLITYQNVNPIDAVEKYGDMIALSGLFGCQNKPQGQALVLMAMSENLSITEMKRRYHIVNGNDLSMRADFMLAEFRRLGGEYSWVDQGDAGKQAILHVKFKTNELDVKFTIEDAKAQGLIRKGSRWEKDPGSMLRARATTKAVRMVCPEVIAGFPTDEELEADGQVAAKPQTPKQEEQIPEAEYTVTTSTPAQPAPEAEEGKATGNQIKELTKLFTDLGIPADAQLKAIQKRGARDMGDLSQEGAHEIIAALRSKLNETVEAPSVAKDDVHSGPADGPCDQQQIDEIKNQIKQLAQTDGDAIPNRIKAHLTSQGMKVADLSSSEAQQLLDCLAKKNLEAFFDASLKGAAKN